MTPLSIRRLLDYFKLTKWSKYYSHFVVVFLIIIAVFGIVPSLYYYQNDLEEKYNVDDLEFLKEINDSEIVVLSAFNEGNIVSYFSGKKNFADSNFILAPNPVQRLGDTEVVYKTFSKSKALEIMKRGNVRYVLLSEKTKETYDIDKILYIDDVSCFEHERETIYKIVC